MNKAELRNLYLEKRLALSESHYNRLNKGIVKTFFESVDLKMVKTLHLFLPILTRKEVDIFLIREILQNDYPEIQLLTSVTDMKNGRLVSCAINQHSELKTNLWGIPEPVVHLPHNSLEIDLVLVPLLIFDLSGHRVGYGKGFYDRFFNECKPNVQKIGLSLFEPIEQIDDVFAGDIQLDACITPEKIYKF